MLVHTMTSAAPVLDLFAGSSSLCPPVVWVLFPGNSMALCPVFYRGTILHIIIVCIFWFQLIANSLRSDQVYHRVPNSEQVLHAFSHTHKWKLKCQSQLRLVAPGWPQQSVGLPQVQDQPGIISETFFPENKNEVKIPSPRPIQIKSFLQTAFCVFHITQGRSQFSPNSWVLKWLPPSQGE